MNKKALILWLSLWIPVYGNTLPDTWKWLVEENTKIEISDTLINHQADTAKYQQDQIDVLSDDLSKCISKSIIDYFNKEITSYSFSEQEQAVLQWEIAKYFSKNKIIQVVWDKIVIKLDKNWVYNLFDTFLPYFMPKLKWYSKLWISLLGKKTCINIVYKDIVNRKWKDAEALYMEDFCTLIKYIVDGIKPKYGGDMTISEWLNTMLIAFPNEHMNSKKNSDQYKKYWKKSISDIKEYKKYLITSK